MNDIVAFLEARIGEDEAVAQEVPGKIWSKTASATVFDGEDDFYAMDQRNASHIVRHDPARVLREVEAKREVVATHFIHHMGVKAYCGGPKGFGCVVCHDWDGVTMGDGWCDTLLALAAIYSNHPDYQEEWRV